MLMIPKQLPTLALEWLVVCAVVLLAVLACIAPSASAGRLFVDRQRLYAHVAFLSAIEGFRHYTNKAGLERSVAYIRENLARTGGRIAVQEYPVDGSTYQNVICTLGPESGPRVVVGAHYDVCGLQPGADDNASAVAGMLEIARLMAERNAQLTYRLDLVAYCLEEPPFFETPHMGSYIHAKSLHAHKVQVKEMICLEMIGYFSEQQKSQSFPVGLMKWFYPTTGNFIGVVSNLTDWRIARRCKNDIRAAADIDVCALSAPAFIPGVKLSDHYSYWQFGYPALMITDTAFYRNPNYHQPTDTIDTLNFDKMAEVVRGVGHHILQLQKE